MRICGVSSSRSLWVDIPILWSILARQRSPNLLLWLSLSCALHSDEFKKHKTASPSFLPAFYREWTNYLGELRASATSYSGRDLSDSSLQSLSEGQHLQLRSLEEEVRKLDLADNGSSVSKARESR